MPVLRQLSSDKLRLWACAFICATALPACAPSAAAQSIDYRAEMKQFVIAIAANAHQTNPNCAIFVQNAADLGTDTSYVAAVTGIGQEDLHYGYDKAGKPTAPDVTQAIETNLDRFKSAGKVVLTVDYPFSNKNKLPKKYSDKVMAAVNSCYDASLAKNYVPSVAVLNLNALPIIPGHEPSANSVEPDWAEVSNWAFQLQPPNKQSREDFLAALAASGFDLIVMDYAFDGSAETEFTPQEIAALKSALKGKLLAYISIGQAEDYRWYWHPEWNKKATAPSWLQPEDKSWKGDFFVRYWDPDWQAIIFEYAQKALAQGFDGVYLDVVDAYEYFEQYGS